MPETVQSQQKSKIRYKAVQDKHTRPPMRFRASRMVTLAPFWMRISAQRKPEIPEPTTPMWGLDPIAQKRQMDLIGWFGKRRMQLLMIALNMNSCERRDGRYPMWLDVFWFKAGGKLVRGLIGCRLIYGKRIGANDLRGVFWRWRNS